MQKPFKKVVRTMEGLDVYVNPMFWVSLLVGGIALAAISYGFQMAQDEGQGQSKELNVKGLVRDTLLGGIFTAMAWTFVPEFMNSITNSATSAASSVSTVVSSASSAVGSPAGKLLDVDVQVGPARF
jgi:hypothetical protein